MIRKVLKLNESKMIVIPKPACEKLGIDFGDLIRFNITKVIKGEEDEKISGDKE